MDAGDSAAGDATDDGVDQSSADPADVVHRAFRSLDPPSTPLAVTDVAERVECSTDRARRGLDALRDRGELTSRELDSGPRIWWVPASGDDPDGDSIADDPSSDADGDESAVDDFDPADDPVLDEATEPHADLADEELTAFVDAVRDYAIFALDPEGVVASWNEGARRIKGYEESEIVGEHFSTFYTESEVAEGVPARNLRAAAEEGRVEDEGWRVRQDGTEFWANVVITAIRGEDGELQGFTKVTRDMTERREYRLQLRRERDFSQRLLETSPASICLAHADGRVLRANERMLDRLELDSFSPGEYDLESWDLYDADGQPIPDEGHPWRRATELGEPVYGEEYRVDLPDVGRRWLSVNAAPMADPDRDADLVVLSVEDVTDRVEREHRLERRKHELETELGEILGRISDAFYALDDEWEFTHLNDRAAELLEQPGEDLVGREVWNVVPDDHEDVYRERYERAMETQETVDFEIYEETLGAWFEFNVYPSESGLSIYFRDVTERKEYQRRLEESNERLEQFAYAASHDLQEPLRMVSSYLQLLERRHDETLDEDAREYLEFAVDGADRMRAMIEGLLEYARVESEGDPLEPVDLDDVLADVREDLQVRIEETAADVSVDPLPRVRGDPSQLRQLFLNLLENALTYAGDEPPVVEVEAEPAGSGGEVAVSVRDYGIGIPPEHQEEVFEVFQRLHGREEYSGTGIGLALCQRIADRHGGELHADSEPGESTTFTVVLPAVSD